MEYVIICILIYVTGITLERDPSKKAPSAALKILATCLLVGALLWRALLRFLEQ